AENDELISVDTYTPYRLDIPVLNICASDIENINISAKETMIDIFRVPVRISVPIGINVDISLTITQKKVLILLVIDIVFKSLMKISADLSRKSLSFFSLFNLMIPFHADSFVPSSGLKISFLINSDTFSSSTSISVSFIPSLL